MKKFYAALISLVLFSGARAQSYTGETKINSMQKLAVINEMPYAADITEGAIKKKMSQLGYSGKEEKGFIVYKNVSISSLGPATYNLYFKTERKSRKEKEQSSIYMLLSDNYDAFLNETRDLPVIDNAKTFLNSLSIQAEDVYIESEIVKQEEVVKKADKDYNNSVADGASLEKKRVNIEEDIKKNKEQQEIKRLETEKQKQLLEVARAKRKA
jgi:hypothetical protein